MTLNELHGEFLKRIYSAWDTQGKYCYATLKVTLISRTFLVIKRKRITRITVSIDFSVFDNQCTHPKSKMRIYYFQQEIPILVALAKICTACDSDLLVLRSSSDINSFSCAIASFQLFSILLLLFSLLYVRFCQFYLGFLLKSHGILSIIFHDQYLQTVSSILRYR